MSGLIFILSKSDENGFGRNKFNIMFSIFTLPNSDKLEIFRKVFPKNMAHFLNFFVTYICRGKFKRLEIHSECSNKHETFV